MGKKIFGVLLIVLLIGIAAVNLMKDREEVNDIENPGQVTSASDTDTAAGTSSSGVALGDKPEDFKLQTLDGKEVKLADYEGKKVILNFWATWCPPCKAEMPHMQNYYETSAEKDNVEILAVNLTNSEKGEAAIADFVKQYELTFPIPLDTQGDIGKQFQAYTIPTSYIINTDGTISQKIVGPMDEAMMEQLVQDAN